MSLFMYHFELYTLPRLHELQECVDNGDDPCYSVFRVAWFVHAHWTICARGTVCVWQSMMIGYSNLI